VWPLISYERAAVVRVGNKKAEWFQRFLDRPCQFHEITIAVTTPLTMKRCCLPFFLVCLLQGCYVEPPFVPEFPAGTVEGYEPIYVSSANAGIAFGPARSLKEPGKIYLFDRFLLVNERYEGIHVFDNADPSHPIAVGFLRIPGNLDVAVRNQVLYADHLGDLVALDVSNWQTPLEISRVRQSHWVASVPPEGQRYFACVEPDRGVVTGWRLTTLTNPKCFH